MIDWLFAPLQYPFMQVALGTTLVAAISCALLSCWLVQIGWSLMGDAVSHAVLPGVVLSFILGLPFAVGAFVFGVGAVALIGGIESRSRVKSDAAIGVVFTTLFALGLVLISRTPSPINLTHILFGNVLGVSNSDFLQVLVIGVVVTVALLLKQRDLTLFAFDPRHTHALGISTRWLRALLLGLLALTVVVALQAVGIILVVAMLITPGAIAALVARRMSGMLITATLSTVVASVGGVYLSFYTDVSTGGAVVLCLGGMFLLAFLFGQRSSIRRRLPRPRRVVRPLQQ